MNITFIIGNGFDINVGLETSYDSFIEDYLSRTDKDSDEIEKFKNKIKEEKIESDKNWSDVELSLGKSTRYFLDKSDPGNSFKECYQNMYECLCSYMQREQQKINKSDITTTMCETFVENIKNYTKGLRPTDVIRINENLNKISGGEVYNFISLNYTDVLDKVVDRIKTVHTPLGNRKNNPSLRNSIVDVLHPHGCINKRNVVFAVDNEKQISELSIFDTCHESLKKYMIKQESDELHGEKSDETAYNMLRQSDLIYIYGTSVGETDLTWWRRIIELMLEKSRVILIIHSFKLSKYDSSWTRLDSEPQRDTVIRDFLRFKVLSTEEIETLKNRIFVVSYNIFKDFAEDIQDFFYEKSIIE